MVSHPELGSDPQIGSDRESGCDRATLCFGYHFPSLVILGHGQVCD